MANYNAGCEKCVLCGGEFGINNVCDTKEHIIPNSLGGKDVVKSFICKKCNSETGNTWDASLCNSLKCLTILSGVDRNRKSSMGSVFKGGISKIEYLLDNNGGATYKRPVIEENDLGSTIIKAKNKKSLIDKIKEEGKGNTNTSYNIKDGLIKFSPILERLYTPIDIDDDKASKSIVKTSLALASISEIDVTHCTDALDFLKSKTKKNVFFWYGKNEDIFLYRKNIDVINCVAVHANPHKNIVISYVEYYNFIRAIVVLSYNYSGPEIKKTYCFNPINGHLFDQDIDIDIDIKCLEESKDIRWYDSINEKNYNLFKNQYEDKRKNNNIKNLARIIKKDFEERKVNITEIDNYTLLERVIIDHIPHIANIENERKINFVVSMYLFMHTI